MMLRHGHGSARQGTVGLLLATAGLASACSQEFVVPEKAQIACHQAADCPQGQVCASDLGRCLPVAASCIEAHGDTYGAVSDGNQCTLEGGALGICLAAACVESACGDGFVDLTRGELCDEGPENSDANPDACRTDCRLARCGDGVTDTAEACDDGNTQSGDGCRADCGKIERCGDAILDAGEECDDGNDNPNDACAACRVTSWVATVVTGMGSSGGDPRRLALPSPTAIATDLDGNLLVTQGDPYNIGQRDPGRIFQLDRAGVLALVAGSGDAPGFSGDGGPATGAAFSSLAGLAVDGRGDVYVSDYGNNRVRRVCRSGRGCVAGMIDTVAGTGYGGFGGDCLAGDCPPATEAYVNNPSGLAVDGAGNLYVADTENQRVRKVCFDGQGCTVGSIKTIAGIGRPDETSRCDGGDWDGWGCEGDGDCVSASPPDGTCVAPPPTPLGDGGLAVDALLWRPTGLAVDSGRNVFIADMYHNRIRKICVDGRGCTKGHIETVAGDGNVGSGGDGNAATAAQLHNPTGVAVDGHGNIYIADSDNHRLRKVCGDGAGCAKGSITTLAGDGTAGFSGDGGPASTARLSSPAAVTVDAFGNIFIADKGNQRVRRICGEAQRCVVGTIETVTGDGTLFSISDGGRAAFAVMWRPAAVVADSHRNLYIADQNNHRIRKVCVDGIGCAVGTIATIAGNGTAGFSGDGGPAVTARVSGPAGLAFDAAGDLFFADEWNNRVRRICFSGANCAAGTIDTVAGSGDAGGFTGDGGPATSSRLYGPRSVAFDAAGNLFFADAWNGRIRMVCGDASACTLGTIDTVAGGDAIRCKGGALDGQPCPEPGRDCGAGGTCSDLGDGADATSAYLNTPEGVAIDTAGNVFIADFNNDRIRKVCVDGVGCTLGTIDTIAGGGVMHCKGGASEGVECSVDDDCGSDGTCSIGDGEPALAAYIGFPTGLAFDAHGNLLVGDAINARVRRVCMAGVDCVTGTIGTVAGGGESEFTSGFAGDGGPATGALLGDPYGIALDDGGNLYIADCGNDRIRKVCEDGVGCVVGQITTIAGTSLAWGDGPLSSASLGTPHSVVLGPQGYALIADGGAGRVRRIDFAAAELDTVAGHPGGFHDGQDPLHSALYSRLLEDPFGLVLAKDTAGDFALVTERAGHQLRRMNLGGSATAPWTITTFAGRLPRAVCVYMDGNGSPTPEEMQDERCADDSPGYRDGGLDEARFFSPSGMAHDPADPALGDVVYVADSGNHVIRRINLAAATVTTIAGVPQQRGYYGDGVDALTALFDEPTALALGPERSLYIADTGNHRVRRLDLATGIITTVIGDGVPASSGTGAPARLFPVDNPLGLAVDSFGNLYIASRFTVRQVFGGADGLATGDDAVTTIYGTPPRAAFPESSTRCLAGMALDSEQPEQGALYIVDECQGLVLRLERQT
jgi:trimeric autotransporter adhesin